MEKVLQEIEELKRLISEQNLLRKEALTFEEGARYIGKSESHTYKLTSSGKINHYKQGKHIFFKRSELDKWLFQNPVRTVGEIESEAANPCGSIIKKASGSRKMTKTYDRFQSYVSVIILPEIRATTLIEC